MFLSEGEDEHNKLDGTREDLGCQMRCEAVEVYDYQEIQICRFE